MSTVDHFVRFAAADAPDIPEAVIQRYAVRGLRMFFRDSTAWRMSLPINFTENMSSYDISSLLPANTEVAEILSVDDIEQGTGLEATTLNQLNGATPKWRTKTGGNPSKYLSDPDNPNKITIYPVPSGAATGVTVSAVDYTADHLILTTSAAHGLSVGDTLYAKGAIAPANLVAEPQFQVIEVVSTTQIKISVLNDFQDFLVDGTANSGLLTNDTGYGAVKTIAGITYGATSTSINVTAHGLVTEDKVLLTDLGAGNGADELDDVISFITRVDDDNFTLDSLSGTDTTGYVAYVSGGKSREAQANGVVLTSDGARIVCKAFSESRESYSEFRDPATGYAPLGVGDYIQIPASSGLSASQLADTPYAIDELLSTANFADTSLQYFRIRAGVDTTGFTAWNGTTGSASRVWRRFTIYKPRLIANVSVMPTYDILVLPDTVTVRYEEVVAYAILSLVYRIPDRPWSDPQLASGYGAAYSEGVIRAKSRAETDYLKPTKRKVKYGGY